MIDRAKCTVVLGMVLNAAFPALAVVHDRRGTSEPVTFSDGSTATTFDRCGDADLGATIAYPSGETLSISFEGAAHCQPYLVHFVRTRGTSTMYEFSRALDHDPVTTTAFK